MDTCPLGFGIQGQSSGIGYDTEAGTGSGEMVGLASCESITIGPMRKSLVVLTSGEGRCNGRIPGWFGHSLMLKLYS